MQKKARLLLDHLKKTKVLKWNSNGEISYRGNRVPQSNIIDLVTKTITTKESALQWVLANLLKS